MSDDKSSKLRQTADELEGLMQEFDRTKETLVTALRTAKLREDAISEHVKAFDEAKTLIAGLFPIRDNVKAIKDSIVTPVVEVIEDSSGTNRRFGWAGVILAAVGVLASIAVPRISWLNTPPTNREIMEGVNGIKAMVQPAANRNASGAATLVFYDRFESDTTQYSDQNLLDVGDLGSTHGYDRIGFEPRTDLIYHPIDVACTRGCHVSIEAMVRLQESIVLTTRQVSDEKIRVVPPMRVEYTSDGATWKSLESLQNAIRIEWVGKKGVWQSVKTPYVDVSAPLGVTQIRLTIGPYRWERPSAESDGKTIRSATDFDELKVFVAGGQ